MSRTLRMRILPRTGHSDSGAFPRPLTLRTPVDSRHASWVLLVVLTLVILPGHAIAAETIALRDLESQLQDAPDVLVAAAELEQQTQLYEREQAVSGWKVFGTMSNGTFQETTDVNRTRDFNQAALKMGLRYPLMGTRKKEQLNILRAEAQTWEDRHKLEAAARTSLNALRSHYVNYWGCARRSELSNAYLQGRETVERFLTDRTTKGFMLDAERQEILTSFEQAVHNIANAEAMQKRALGVINLLTNSHMSHFTPVMPRFPQPCVKEERLKARILGGSPELALLRSRMDEQLGTQKLGSHSEVDANLDLTGNASVDYPEGEPGYGLSVSVNVQLPVRVRKANEAARRAAQAGLNKAKLELDRKTGELLVDGEESLERYHAAYANLRLAQQRVKAALESVRENQLRTGFLPEGTFDKLQRSRFQYYQTSMDLIDAEVFYLQSQAALLQLAPEGCADGEADALAEDSTQSVITNDPVHPNWLAWPKSTPQWVNVSTRSRRAPKPSPEPPPAPAHPLAVYHWESGSWLDGSIPCDRTMDELSASGIGRVLIGLTGSQIAAARTEDGGRRLRSFLECAKGRGVSVELLLGEPTWILPSGREDLLNIVLQLKDFPFDGLHLDLEPDQLDAKTYSRDYLLGELIHTLQAVSKVSPWPVGISLHPRYFDKHETKLCVGCALQTLKISEVVLMVYVSDPDKAARRVLPILKANPELTFSVAVSVEPTLPNSESYAEKGKAVLVEALETLRRRLARSNFSSLLIQSWSYFETMKP